jgi:UTP:GlnB (protein PII) uridylyltransferase
MALAWPSRPRCLASRFRQLSGNASTRGNASQPARLVSHADRHLFEVRFPLHFRAGKGAEKLGAGMKDVPQGLRVCVRPRSWKGTA